MVDKELSEMVSSGAETLGIDLPPAAAKAFEDYHYIMAARGQAVNLTAISDINDIASLHFLDSIALLNAIPFKDKRVIDIGSGAGFPGIPLKIAEPSIDLTLIDALKKRVTFLSQLCATLELDATCIHIRAEDAAHDLCMREQYDIVLSRAVAKLNILCELCLPFARVGGVFLAMKGVDSSIELDESKNAIETLGAEFLKHFDYTLPDTDITHRVILIRKTSETPANYPRRFARIKKTPL